MSQTLEPALPGHLDEPFERLVISAMTEALEQALEQE